MAHSSLPIYLDPSNWPPHQLSNDHNEDPRQVQVVTPFLPQAGHVSGVASSIRPGSMAYRARLAMIPQPEASLKCPRCESTNTKFCYFNNYSLSQPRHFCKACRRYWTRGGALRNVPVGGGFRKNKKKKKNSRRSKSPTATETETGNSRAARSGCGMISAGCNIDQNSTVTVSHLPSPQAPPHLPLMAASLQVQSLSSRLGGGNGITGLNFSGLQIGNMMNSNSSSLDFDQQSAFIVAGLEESHTAVGYPEPNSTSSAAVNNLQLQYCHHQFHENNNFTPPFSKFTHHHRPFHYQQLKKIEENQNQNRNEELQLQAGNGNGIPNNGQFWGAGHQDHQSSWTDLSAISSSSSSHLL